MKKKIPAVFAVLLALTLTISQVVCAFAETAAQTDAIAFADGTYTVPADTDQRMFYIVSDETNGRTATLTVKDGQMTAAFSLTGTGYDMAYMGSAEDAAEADAALRSGYTTENGHYTYTVAVSALDQPLDIAMHAVKSGKWFQHTIIFYSSKEAKERIENEQKQDSEQNQKPKPDSDTDQNTDKNTNKNTDKNTDEKDSENAGNKNNTKEHTKSQPALSDGTYTPDQFSWSGGSGRLAYIACDKITVKKGKSYATIRFSSASYDKVQAGGGTYRNTGSAESTFTIPVTLNANNQISARTVAMSAPHWVDYTIYPYLEEVGKGSGGVKQTTGQKPQRKDTKDKDGKDKKAVSAIIGLGEAEEVPMEYAAYCKLYRYANGIKLLQIDLTTASGLSCEKKSMEAQTEVAYDEDGKPIAKLQSEITQALYQNSTVRYLLVPEGIEVPAGLDKEMIVVSVPADKTWSISKPANQFMQALGCEAMLTTDASKAENPTKPDFKSIVQEENNLAIVQLSLFEDTDTGQTAAQKQSQLETLEKRFATLQIPVILDRSADETTLQGKAEWVKVYAALYGAENREEAALTAMQEEAFWDSLADEDTGVKADSASEASTETKNHNEENHANAFLYAAIAAVIVLLAATAGIMIKKNKIEKNKIEKNKKEKNKTKKG